MALLDTTGSLTLLELANRMDPKGDTAIIAEVLTQTNAILKDAVWIEANGVTYHQCTRRISLPTGQWRKINAGVATETSQTEAVKENIGMLESYSEVDKKLVQLAPNPEAFRMSESKAFIEGMGQTLASTMLYGDESTNPERFTGLAPRLNLLALGNVVNSGVTGTNSIYVVQWGEDKVFMTYPKGSKTVGIEHEDKGQVTLQDADGNNYEGYRDHFYVNCGLSMRDDRCIARLANISTTGTFNEDNLIQLVNTLPYEGRGAVMYANQTIFTRMEIRLKDKNNVFWKPGDGLGGAPLLYFRGVPIRRVDAALSTETVVV